MSSNAIISNGIGDTALYFNSAANVDAPFKIDAQSGQYPAVGNIAVNRKLASMWQGIYLGEKIFADGLGITSMNAEEEGAVAVRVPLLLPAPRTGRTLSMNFGGFTKPGTPGNDSPFNNRLPHGMQTDAIDVTFRQVYDEAAQVSKSQMRMIGANLDLLGQYTSGIPKTVAMLTDADVLGTQVGAALKLYKDKPSANNIIFYDPSATTEGYLQGILNSLVSALSNIRAGYKEGVVQYPQDKSVIIMKYSLWNKFLTIKNGALVNSDISTKILINGNFTEDGKKLLGGAIKGQYNGVYIKVVPDEYWYMAAAFCGIPKASLSNWDKVSAYIANAAGTYHGRNAVTTEVDKAPTTSIGFIVRNDWQWGTQVARKSSIALLVEGTAQAFTNPITDTEYDVEGYTIQPYDMEAVLEEYYDGEVRSSGQAIGVSNLVTDCKLTLTDALSADIKNAVLTIISNGAVVSYQNNGDSTYSFTLGRGDTAKVIIEAEGYDTATLDVATTDTVESTKALSKTLTASGD